MLLCLLNKELNYQEYCRGFLITNIKLLSKFSETSNFDDAPKWDEAQRETVNRNLSIEFDAENTTHETDTTDDASAINRNQKFNQSKVCFLQINKE